MTIIAGVMYTLLQCSIEHICCSLLGQAKFTRLKSTDHMTMTFIISSSMHSLESSL